jgi:hypothetical protein
MATIEMITTNDGEGDYKRPGFNVSETVGVGGKNQMGDVMLIQSMLHYINLGAPVYIAGVLEGMSSPSGVFDAATGRAIKRFQRKWADHLLQVDGLVHPGAFKGRRIITKSGSTQMTIYHLNFLMRVAAMTLHGGGFDFTEVVLREFPALRLWVKKG